MDPARVGESAPAKVEASGRVMAPVLDQARVAASEAAFTGQVEE
jgi:hypothetical protein